MIPGLDFTYTRNSGVAFGALAGGGALIAVLIGVALVSLLGYFALHAAQSWLWLPVGMLIGGALGNLADRGREGAVIDFVDPIALAGLQRRRRLHRDRGAGAAVRRGHERRAAKRRQAMSAATP